MWNVKPMAGGFLPLAAAGALAAWFVVPGPASAMQAGNGAPPASASTYAPPHQGREISDQEHARNRRQRGQNQSFELMLRRAGEVGRGQYLGVEPDISTGIYRFKFMRTGGNIVWVDIDGRTGREVSVQQ